MAPESKIVSLQEIIAELQVSPSEPRESGDTSHKGEVSSRRNTVNAGVSATIETLDGDLVESVEELFDVANERAELAHLEKSIAELVINALIDTFMEVVISTLDKKALSAIAGEYRSGGVYRTALMNELKSSLVLSVFERQQAKKSSLDTAIMRIKDTHISHAVPSAANLEDLHSKEGFMQRLASHFINLTAAALLTMYKLCLADESFNAEVHRFFAVCDEYKKNGTLSSDAEVLMQDHPQYHKLKLWRQEHARITLSLTSR